MRDGVNMTNHMSNDAVTIHKPWYLNRGRLFLLFNAVFLIAFAVPLRDLMVTSWNSGYYTYIPFIPFISAYLIYDNRSISFSQKESSYAAGPIIMSIGILLVLLNRNSEALFDNHYHETLITFSIIIIWIGGFTLIYGNRSLRAAAFPLLFLFLAVPVPDAVLEKIIVFLQTGSAEISYMLLQATGMPIARDGFVFHLPVLDIEVAKECSGIRSSLSLFITGLLAAYFFLRTIWARAILMLLIVPIAIIKNGIRITVLSVLGVYWDERILASDLHRKGGFVFFLIALIIVWAVIMALKKMERKFNPKTV